MQNPHDTQPKRPQSLSSDTQPKRPQPQRNQARQQVQGPGCWAWGILSVIATAFSIGVVAVAGLFGYLNGQALVTTYATGTLQAVVQEQITTLIPQDIAEGNVALLGLRIAGLASLTPPPDELAGLIATGTQFAIDNQPTATHTPTPSATASSTAAPLSTSTIAPTTDTTASSSDDDALFDLDALFAEAQTQMAIADYDEATKTLDAIMAIDETFRPVEVEEMMFDALYTQANNLLRSGSPGTLAAGIVKADEAELYGDIGNLGGERYIAGLYLNAVSQEATNPQGAINRFNQVYASAPNYMDVRNRIFDLYVQLGDISFENEDYCAAASQYTSALQFFQSGDVQTRQQTAQTSCGTGQAPADTSSAGEGSGDSTTDTTAPATSAPIGQR